jgi:hypothetical protein
MKKERENPNFGFENWIVGEEGGKKKMRKKEEEIWKEEKEKEEIMTE